MLGKQPISSCKVVMFSTKPCRTRTSVTFFQIHTSWYFDSLTYVSHHYFKFKMWLILTCVQYTRLLTEKPAATPYSLTQWTEKSTTVDPIGLRFCWIHNDRFPLLAKLHSFLQRLCSLYSSCAPTRPLNNVIINDNQWHVTRILLNRRLKIRSMTYSPAARSGFGWGGSPQKLENFCWCG
jgi:hypothetical protein